MGGHAVTSGFTILRFAEPDLPDVAYLEHLTSALYFDKKSEVDRYLLAMERLSVVAAKPNQTTGILTTIIDELEEERAAVAGRPGARGRDVRPGCGHAEGGGPYGPPPSPSPQLHSCSTPRRPRTPKVRNAPGRLSCADRLVRAVRRREGRTRRSSRR